MEILDNEEKPSYPTGKTLGTIGSICYSFGGIVCLIGTYGSWLYYTGLNRSGAPDASSVGTGLQIVLFAQFISLFSFLVGIICQRIAFSKYNFSPIWLWRILVFSSIAGFLGGLLPPNPVILIIVILTFVHAYTKKVFYAELEEE